MKYFYADESCTICSEGKEGDLFFVLVQGSCDVLVPMLKTANPADYYEADENSILYKKTKGQLAK